MFQKMHLGQFALLFANAAEEVNGEIFSGYNFQKYSY